MSVVVSYAACGWWFHRFWKCGCATDTVPLLPVSWYSFCRPRKHDRLSQPTWCCYFNSTTGAPTQDPKILSQPTSPLSQHQAFDSCCCCCCYCYCYYDYYNGHNYSHLFMGLAREHYLTPNSFMNWL